MQEKANNFASPRASIWATLLGVGFFLIAATPLFAFAQVAPTVDIKANGQDGPITISSGSSVTVTWNVSNATSCFASGSWGGNKPDSGSETFSNITSTKIYSLTCVNSAGPSTFDSVTVNVNTPPQNPTVDIKANGQDGPVTIGYNTSATLSWTSQNATNCSASGSWNGNQSLSGSTNTGNLQNSQTYTITCTNSAGSDSDSVTVLVQQVQNPTVDIRANGSNGPITIASGSQANLSWTSNNATSCQASSGPWSGTKQLDSSAVTQALFQATTYGITCQNAQGVTVSDSVTINIQQSNPTVDIKANGSDGPVQIIYNSSATLSWVSSNASSCNASGSWSGTKTLAGSESTGSLTQPRTYTITCINSSNQSVTDSVTVNVDTNPQLPTVDIKANGQDGTLTLPFIQPFTLSWLSNNATSCSASNGWTGSKTLSGSEIRNSNPSFTTYTITCTNSAGQSVSDSVSVLVQGDPQPPTVDLRANGSNGPITIQSGAQANLSWTSNNATNCQATSGPWNGTKPLNSSEVTQSLFQSTTYTITCTNSQGLSASDSVTINIQQVENPTVDIKANGSDGPVSVSSGNTALISWTSSNTVSCFASNAWSGTKATNGQETSNTLFNSSTFTVTCQNSQGVTASDSVTVNVNQVQNPTVDIKANSSDGPITIASASQATLSWSSNNATTCNASSGPWSGTKPLNSSEVTQTLTQSATYTITCTNSVGASVSDSVTINIQNTQNPPTVDIKANGSDGPITVNYNSTANLSWTSNNATSCYASGGNWSGSKNTNSSDVTQTLTQSNTYSITCTNSSGQSTTDSVTVNVNTQQQNAPTVTLNASPNSVISGSQSRLYWTSQNATSCQSAGGPWYGTKPLNSDEVTQALFQTTTYTITCQNAAGQTATASTVVTVQGVSNSVPTLNLYANPNQVPVGSNSTLYWNTTNADYCIASGDGQSGWVGNKAVNGSQSVGPIFATQNFILTCYGQGGNVVRNTTVSPIGQVLGAAAPTLTIYALPTPVNYGSGSNIYWNATNVDRCNASTDWFGGKPINGQEQTGPLFAAKTYTMTCYGQGGTITRSAVVPVVGGPVYVPPTCPVGGCVQGVTGTYGASIDKIIENLSTPGASGSQVTARPGNELRYTITVRNTGTLTLTNLTVRDPLTDKVEVKSISDAGTYDYANRTVTWKIARLGAGESKTLTLNVRVIMCDTDIVIENRAYVKNSQINEISSNNTVAGVVTGPFTVTIDNPSPIVAPGDKVTYTVRYRNDSGATVRGAVLEVFIPAGMVIEGYSQTCTVSGNTVRLNIGDVVAGQSGQVQVIGKIDAAVLDGEQLVTRATVSYNDATGAKRESTATTMSTVDKDGNAGVVSNSDSDAEFAAAASAGTSRGLSFLPDTFFGWLLLLLLIIVMAIFVKRLLTKD